MRDQALNGFGEVGHCGRRAAIAATAAFLHGRAQPLHGMLHLAGDAASGDLQQAIERLRTAMDEGGNNRGTTAAMANLAEAIQGLVAHMRTEQQMIREWADGQGEQNREIKKLLERIAKQPEKS